VGDTGELRSTHHAATTTVEGSGAVDVCRVDRELLDRVATQRVEAKKQHCHTVCRRGDEDRWTGERKKKDFFFSGTFNCFGRPVCVCAAAIRVESSAEPDAPRPLDPLASPRAARVFDSMLELSHAFFVSMMLSSMPVALSCIGRADCNFNGVCVNSTCVCLAQWKGVGCDELVLLPSPKHLGYRGTDAKGRVTSWGGSVVLGDDGFFHMYASEIVDGCGMNVWLANSRVIHARSLDPTREAFERVSEVSGVFSHEPIAARAPTGEYVIYFTAVLPPKSLPVYSRRRCLGCTNGTSLKECGDTSSNMNHSVHLPTFMVYSTSPDGPWSEPAIVPGTDKEGDSNFAPLIKADGSLIALTRNKVWAATNWKDLASYHVVNRWNKHHGEDPSLWVDGDGVFHSIIHVGRPGPGLHYWSTDGFNWSASTAGGHAFTPTLLYDDGTTLDLACRERPHVVLDRGGAIVALTTGASPVACDTTGMDDFSFTALQLVGQAEP